MTDARDESAGGDAPAGRDDAREEAPFVDAALDAPTEAAHCEGNEPAAAGASTDLDDPDEGTGADSDVDPAPAPPSVDAEAAVDDPHVAVPEIFVPSTDAEPDDRTRVLRAVGDLVAAPGVRDDRGSDDEGPGDEALGGTRSDEDAWNAAMSRPIEPDVLTAETPLAALVAAGAARSDDPHPTGTEDGGPELAEAVAPAPTEQADEPEPLDEAEAGLADAPGEPRDEHAATPGATAPKEPNGWLVLARAMAPRANRSQVLAGVLCALLGFALVVQVRQNDDSALSGLRQSELVRILDETTERGDQLRREVAELRGERDDLASGSDRQAAAIDSLRRSAITQGILSGRLPAQGPGVRVTLLDPDGDLQPVTMLNMLEELRNAGAEAIQLNDQRVTASSAFTGTRGRVVLDGVELTQPYVWLAIGDPSTLSIALQIPGGAMATVRGTGANGTVDEQDEVAITALRRLPEPSFATPAPPEGG